MAGQRVARWHMHAIMVVPWQRAKWSQTQPEHGLEAGFQGNTFCRGARERYPSLLSADMPSEPVHIELTLQQLDIMSEIAWALKRKSSA